MGNVAAFPPFLSQWRHKMGLGTVGREREVNVPLQVSSRLLTEEKKNTDPTQFHEPQPDVIAAGPV